jgi:hypothetical protein
MQRITHYMECMYSTRKTTVRNAGKNNNLFVIIIFLSHDLQIAYKIYINII